MTILVFEDKLGITSGYRDRWDEICRQVGLRPMDFIYKSAHKHPAVGNLRLLIKKGNRKNPGFNQDQSVWQPLWVWFTQTIMNQNPDVIVIQDAALLGFLDADWDQSTIDNLRGGLYWLTLNGIRRPIIVTVPVSAINTGRKTKDIKILNHGASTKEEWEARQQVDEDSEESDVDNAEHDPDEFFMEPYYVPEGRWILKTDLRKVARIHAQQTHKRIVT